MAVTAALIQTLHRMNRQKADLQGQLERGPRIIAAARGRVKEAESELDALRQTIRQTRMEVDQKQLQMEEREAKIRHWQGQLNTVKENREYQALKDQIAAETQANAVLSDEILELLESLDSLAEQEQQQLVALEKIRQESQETEARIIEKRAALEKELARVEKELAEAEKGLEGIIRREYFRLVEARGEDALAELDGNSCSGCYQTLTPQLLEQLRVGQPVLCSTCGRVVYRPS
ncbi:MAG: phospholipase [Pirellulaceae bacterium]|nr:MAG: phospholipase [Pirellulaceae bacterium]